jgi:hypothetical protein
MYATSNIKMPISGKPEIGARTLYLQPAAFAA